CVAARGARAADSKGGAFGLCRSSPTLTFSRYSSVGFAILATSKVRTLQSNTGSCSVRSKTYDELAAELARLAPDAIVVVGTPPALAAKWQTTTIPIIMAPAADPLRSGLAASLSRPGGNVTGVSLYGSEIARISMLIPERLKWIAQHE